MDKARKKELLKGYKAKEKQNFLKLQYEIEHSVNP